jgi:hypothetical protein
LVIPVLGRLRQEEHEFKVSLGNIARSYFKEIEKKEVKEREK